MNYAHTWDIDKFSYSVQKNSEALESPLIFISGLNCTSWRILLYPRGRNIGSKGSISIFLERYKHDVGHEKISLIFELSLLGAEGQVHRWGELQYSFGKGDAYGYEYFLQRSDLFSKLKGVFLLKDTLMVFCKMRTSEGDIHKGGQGSSRTVIGTEHISFLNVIEGFSTLKCDQAMNYFTRYSEDAVCVTISVSKDLAITSEITVSNNNILSKCNLFLVGASGILSKCGEGDNRADDDRKDIGKMRLCFTRDYIADIQPVYFPDDKLRLLYHCTFSTGVKYANVYRTLDEVPLSVLSHIRLDLDNVEYKVDEKSLRIVSLSTDQELKKIPCPQQYGFWQFVCLFINYLDQWNTDCIQVNGLENDAVEKLLTFRYSDILENSKWDSAMQLSYAADKYDMKNLKLMCSSLLLYNLVSSNAVELLLLADTQNASGLQKNKRSSSAGKNSFQCNEQVYAYDELLKLDETNTVLVGKSMRLKYK